jgi:hypothetical protein
MEFSLLGVKNYGWPSSSTKRVVNEPSRVLKFNIGSFNFISNTSRVQAYQAWFLFLLNKLELVI